MERTAVRSRDLAIVGYETDTKVLEVAFRSGGVYQYDQVPEELYRGLLEASSHGVYFRDHIKEKFSCRKIS